MLRIKCIFRDYAVAANFLSLVKGQQSMVKFTGLDSKGFCSFRVGNPEEDRRSQSYTLSASQVVILLKLKQDSVHPKLRDELMKANSSLPQSRQFVTKLENDPFC